METPIRLLLIEDNPGDARLVRELLTESRCPSFKIEHADRLQIGLTKLSQGSFDLVLLDLHLPDGTGLENVIQVHKAAPRIPVVVMTGTLTEQYGLDALKKGAQDYLLKEQLGPHLSRAIQYAIVRKQLEIKQGELTAAVAVAEVEQKKAQELEKAYQELKEKSAIMERFHKATVDRELQMITLKEEVNLLLQQLGQPTKYKASPTAS